MVTPCLQRGGCQFTFPLFKLSTKLLCLCWMISSIWCVCQKNTWMPSSIFSKLLCNKLSLLASLWCLTFGALWGISLVWYLMGFGKSFYVRIFFFNLDGDSSSLFFLYFFLHVRTFSHLEKNEKRVFLLQIHCWMSFWPCNTGKCILFLVLKALLFSVISARYISLF